MDDARLLSWIETGQIAATLLVAIGVVGEFAGSFIARPIARRLEAQREGEMARLRKETADAQLRAAELEEFNPAPLSYEGTGGCNRGLDAAVRGAGLDHHFALD